MKNVYKYALSTNVDSALEKHVFLLYRIFYITVYFGLKKIRTLFTCIMPFLIRIK